MNPQNRDEIAKRAYAIWQREGQPEGRATEHWHMAEQELAREDEPGNGSARRDPAPVSRKPALVRSRPRKSGT